jgi:catechol 2,3-dioxygenase-like lactoylglutathione lyase family enzyme
VTVIMGVHHLGLTVSDAERSARWYEAVLGFDRVGGFGDGASPRRKVFLRHPGFGIRLGLVEHREAAKQRFDETRPGLDHLAFEVATDQELVEWAHRLRSLGIPFTPIAASHSIPGAAVIVFRDPDNIQLELFTDPTKA